jgi:hypothetical protein
MNNYKSVYKNVGATPRSVDEAFKTADYATPIWRCETDTEKGIKFFVGMVVGMLVVASPLLLVYSFMIWLDTVK